MATVYGYARPTASRPDLADLADELKAAGAQEVFVERNRVEARRGLQQRRRLLEQIGPDDTLILPSLHLLGTALEDILECLTIVVDRGATLQLLDADFETAQSALKAYSDLLKLLAGARSKLRGEAISANLSAARAKGGKATGKEPVLKREQWPRIRERINEAPLETVAQEYGVHRQTLWTYRRRMKALDEAETR